MSNLKFKHDVNSYEEAKALYEQGVSDLCYNTYLAKHHEDFVVMHHSTAIVTFHPDGSTTLNGAWVSATTANRLHHYKPEIVERINRRSVENGRYAARYIVTLRNHPGTVDIWEGQRYRFFPDYTVVSA